MGLSDLGFGMKKLLAFFAVFALAFALPGTASADDEVTEPSVSVGDFGQYLVQKGKKAIVKPEVVKQGAVTVKSAKMTVKHGKKTVARNVKSVKLRAGSYQVTTTIRWTVTGNPTVQTTIAIKPLRITTFGASKQRDALFSYINAARLKAPGIADAIATGADPASFLLKHSAELDRIATSWAKKDAKAGKVTKRDWWKFTRYEYAWDLPMAGRNPYYPSMAAELGAALIDNDSPLIQCGARMESDDVVSDCGDVVPWDRLGIGFAWIEKGKNPTLVLNLIVATAKQ